jgi:uncharacterized integral membrane protein
MSTTQANHSSDRPVVYQGQFGEFTITERDRQGVQIYRAGLAVAALCWAVGTGLVLWEPQSPLVLSILTPLYAIFCIALGISLLTIHIYLAALHRLLQLFWGIGVVTSAILAVTHSTPLATVVYEQPLTVLGVGCVFAALTGIFFKEAFCFNRLETKVLTPLVPLLLLGHWSGLIPIGAEKLLLGVWAILQLVFAGRKLIQPIPPDIGDKSVFDYLRQQRLTSNSH